ncbi:hypothetical protein [Flavobacterium sp. CS20]|uniref:hypothetical protein n=1 Tax=Flavobacterium sp. CS20 TaxID=2775246 RepID=UPI001B3A03C9|nr:hypothetical protein [Flavobacterium sp. CS20]QTY27802.1 hypothetical protein IGB25_04585 [Flavobacterium sp. CS20]
MKSNKFLTLIIVSIFFSCTEIAEDISVQNESNSTEYQFKNGGLNLDEKLTVNRTTTFISKLLINSGVIKLNVVRDNDAIKYYPTTLKQCYLDDELVDLNDYTLVVVNNYAFLERNPDFKLSFSNNNLFLNSNGFTGIVEDNHFDLFDNIDKKVALILLKEVTISEDNKFSVIQPNDPNNPGDDYTPIASASETCSWWNTITYTYFGNTRSVAESRAGHQMELSQQLHDLGEQQGLNFCEPFGEVDSSCIWDNHGCVASYSVCCD